MVWALMGAYLGGSCGLHRGCEPRWTSWERCLIQTQRLWRWPVRGVPVAGPVPDGCCEQKDISSVLHAWAKLA